MTPEEIRALGFKPHVPGEDRPVKADVQVGVLFGDGEQSFTWRAGSYDWHTKASGPCVIGWRYADPADAQRVIAAKDEKLVREAGWLADARRYITVLEDEIAAKDAEIARLADMVRELVTVLTYADPPKLFNGVLCHEARAPVEFVIRARALLENTK